MILKALSTLLVDARIPILEDYLKPSLQSALVETIFWTIGYVVYCQTFSRVLRAFFRRRKFWYTAHKRGGLFTQNAQDDLPAFFITGVQHMYGGILMAVGIYHSNPTLWRHGFLLETGFEVADLISIALKISPYDSGVKEDLIVPIICHHIPGVLVAAPVIESGLQNNPHLTMIGMWLLLVGGISLLCAFYIATLDFDRDMKKAAFVNTANILCFVYARFVVFPWHSYHLMNDIRAGEHGTFFVGSFGFYFVAMSVYNLGALAELLPQGIRYVRRAMDGITVIDDGPVPPPKEGKMKQRRSSVIRMLQKADDALHRRPSLTGHTSSMKRFSAVLAPDPIFLAECKND